MFWTVGHLFRHFVIFNGLEVIDSEFLSYFVSTGIHQKRQNFRSGKWLTCAFWCSTMIWRTVVIILQRKIFLMIKQCFMQLVPWLVFCSTIISCFCYHEWLRNFFYEMASGIFLRDKVVLKEHVMLYSFWINWW